MIQRTGIPGRSRTRRALLALVAGATMLVAGTVAAPGQAAPGYDNLDPGGQPRLTERVPVNVVFLGYEPSQVDRATFVDGLPRKYEPVVRSRLNYGTTEKLGIHYTYDYNVQYTGKQYEDRFFGRLKQLAEPAPLTVFQEEYNKQKKNVLKVRNNHHIDAPSVERWLALNPPAGVDTTRNTVFFVNWFGRSDFKFHVYTKTNEPDPDTGYNFGVERESRKIIAWGGTTAKDEEDGLGSTRRVWFHDLSAGPEAWTANYIVDQRDLDDNGVEDYRMPPIWEYRENGYRRAAKLSSDLSKITRYVAINLLFTTSPLYPPELPTGEPPRSINLDSNTYEGWPGMDASRKLIDRELVLDELRELRWRNRFSYDSQDLPFKGAARRCYVGLLNDESCYPQLGFPSFANLVLQNTFQLGRTQDDQGKVDYELPIFNYATTEKLSAPFLGFADDDYRTGTQSYVFNFVSPGIVDAGYGLTTTMIHEVGHHLAMSHPHDGYDSQRGIDYGPSDQFFFAWAGDETNSMMSYIDLNWDFSQFDRDNSDRFLAAAYVEAANRLAAEVLADKQASQVKDKLATADRLVGDAETAFSSHYYRGALVNAQKAYERVAEAAREIGVSTESGASVMEDSARHGAARESDAEHETGIGDFIDSLEPGGPRSQP